MKTCLVIFIVDRPGALYRILQEFAVRALNLTGIESRPTGNRLGEYHFFIDLIGHREDPPVAEALEAVSWFKKAINTYFMHLQGLIVEKKS